MSVDNFISRFAELTEDYKFYDGRITLRYDIKNHEYLLVKDNELISQPSVTSIVHIIDKSAALINWACKMMYNKLLFTITPERLNGLSYPEFEQLVLEAKSAHKEKLEEAADVGHIAHAWLEDYINLLLSDPIKNWEIPVLPEDERAANCCRAALDWMQKHNVRWQHTERKIYSEQYGYAGTLDGVAVCDSCDNALCCPVPFKDHKSLIDWKCLLPEQTLLMADGSTIRADQVMPGDMLHSFDEVKKEYVTDKVKEVFPGGEQPCVEIVSKLGRRLKVSANHPVYIKGQWINAGDLKINDPLTIFKSDISEVDTITEDEATLLGYFIGDGGFSDPTSRTFTNNNPHVLEEFKRICNKLGFIVSQMGRRENQFNIGGCGSFLRNHDIYCCNSKEKHIPKSVMAGSEKIIKAFISAYFDCDGYVTNPYKSNKCDVYITTISERLALEVQELMGRLGVPISVWRQDNKKYKNVKHNSPPYWVKCTDKYWSRKFLEQLNLKVDHKKERREQWLERTKYVKEKTPIQDYVKQITPLGTLKTIGIEMENTGTFITSGILTHNSSNALYIEYLYQTAAYQKAFVEETKEEIIDRWIIRLGKDDGEFEPWFCGQETFADDFNGFRLCLELCRSVDLLNDRMKTKKNHIKKALKEQANLEKQAALKIKCKGANKYKGIKPPQCNDNNPCEYCLKLYEEKHKDVKKTA